MTKFLAFLHYLFGALMSFGDNWAAATFFMVTACFWMLQSIAERDEAA